MRALIRDGVRLVVEEAGPPGAPALVFVHGWTCDRSHFAPQVARFSPDHYCIALDLRGHGESDAPEQDYTIDAFADDVGWICDQLGIARATLVGHSMGGAVVLALSHARPELVRTLVLLDPAILFPPAVVTGSLPLIDAFGAPGGMEVLRQFEAGQFFLDSSDPALKERLLDAACRTPQPVVVSAIKNLVEWDAEPALRSLTAPLLYVGAEPQITDRAKLREFAPHAVMANTAGSGHFHQLEVPDQVNAMLVRFLAINAHVA
jgi:pimeloyl-ACP methyl ester carboxylesterase